MLAIVSIESTLAQPGTLQTVTAHRAARPFYEALSSQYHLIALTQATPDIAEWWLRKERMPKWSSIHCWNESASIFNNLDWKVDTVREFLAEGWEIAFYVDANDSATRAMTSLGVASITLSYPTINPGWRDLTTPPRPWEAIAATVDAHVGGDDGTP